MNERERAITSRELAEVQQLLREVMAAEAGRDRQGTEDAWALGMAMRRLAILIEGTPAQQDIVCGLRRVATQLIESDRTAAVLSDAGGLLGMLGWRLRGPSNSANDE